VTAPVTALVLTQNNATIVARCIRSLAFAREVVVVDAQSSDDTAHIARSLGARVVERSWTGFADQRNVALAHASEPWVFVCDSDEEVTPELAREIVDAVSVRNDATAFRVRRRNQFLGRWMDVGPWADDTQLRLFRRDAVRVTDVAVHESYAVDGPVATLASFLNHYTHTTLAESVQRLNRYTSLEARERATRRRIRALDSCSPRLRQCTSLCST
jgi:glycosyltransferase involved in cell wall biosynthesis